MKIKMKKYDILIQTGIFLDIKKHVDFKDNKVFIITDENVYKLNQDNIEKAFQGFEIIKYVISPGEKSKSFEVYQNAINFLFENGIKRFHHLIALGGGVVGDLTGFIASTIYRGINYIQIPTTLLSQVDSSIGGKTGIDSIYGKNLIGSFYEPEKVLIDPNFLNTLSKREFSNGLSEMIKAGLIADKKLFELIESGVKVDEELIKRAILVKKRVVLKDPLDKGIRMILNFGHTFGHAIEYKHNFETYKHGEAIAYGMLIALKMGESLEMTQKDIYERVLKIFLKYNLVKEPLLQKDDYIDYIKNDKKILSNGLNFIFIEKIGKAVIKNINIKDV